MKQASTDPSPTSVIFLLICQNMNHISKLDRFFIPHYAVQLKAYNHP